MRQFVDESGIGALGVDTGAPGSAVSANSDTVIGHLALDATKFTAALEADPAGARKTISGKGGFGEAFTALLAPTLGTGGTISGRLDAVSGESKRISESMTALNARLEQREERLHMQFAKLESALLANQTQSSWLNGQLGQLSS
jgi:flagellar hook-associated protein 2